MRFPLAAVLILSGIAAGCGQSRPSWLGKPSVPVSAVEGEPAAEAAEPSSEESSPATAASMAEAPAASQPSASASADPVGEVVAASVLQINGRFLTMDDILSGARGELEALPANLPEPTFRQHAQGILTEEIRRQVTRALVLAEANRRLSAEHLGRIDEEVDKARHEMIIAAGGSEARLEQEYAQKGTSLEAALEDYRRSVIAQVYLQGKFQSQIVITREMLMREYDRRKGDLATPRKVQMQIISVGRETALGDPAERIADAQRAVRGGEDFGEVAQRLSAGPKASEGGIWPLMPAESFRHQAVEEVAFSLSEGQVSDIIETETGFFLVKALVVVPAQQVSFEQAQDEIGRDLRQQKYQEMTTAYFQELMAGATIVQSRQFLPMALDRAVAEYGGG